MELILEYVRQEHRNHDGPQGWHGHRFCEVGSCSSFRQQEQKHDLKFGLFLCFGLPVGGFVALLLVGHLVETLYNFSFQPFAQLYGYALKYWFPFVFFGSILGLAGLVAGLNSSDGSGDGSEF